MRRYGAALALGLAVLFGWAELSEADGRGRGRGHGHGHHGSHGHHRFHGHGFRGHGFHGHFRHHHHGFHGRAFIGASPFFWSPGYVYTPPPVYVRPQPAGYWYFCRSAQAYYPYVAACPEGWIPVPAD
jgi:hypothetical protein